MLQTREAVWWSGCKGLEMKDRSDFRGHSLLGWRPSLLGWRPSLLGWRPSLRIILSGFASRFVLLGGIQWVPLDCSKSLAWLTQFLMHCSWGLAHVDFLLLFCSLDLWSVLFHSFLSKGYQSARVYSCSSWFSSPNLTSADLAFDRGICFVCLVPQWSWSSCLSSQPNLHRQYIVVCSSENGSTSPSNTCQGEACGTSLGTDVFSVLLWSFGLLIKIFHATISYL